MLTQTYLRGWINQPWISEGLETLDIRRFLYTKN